MPPWLQVLAIVLTVLAVWWLLVVVFQRAVGRKDFLTGPVVQASLAALVVMLPFKPPLAVVSALFLPSLVILGYVGSGYLVQFADVLTVLVASFAVIAYAVFRIVKRTGRMANFAVFLSLTIGSYGAFGVAEVHSRIAMCAAARELGVAEIERRSFFFSLRHAPSDSQTPVHGVLRKDRSQFGWSYRDMDWYRPSGGWLNTRRGVVPYSCRMDWKWPSPVDR